MIFCSLGSGDCVVSASVGEVSFLVEADSMGGVEGKALYFSDTLRAFCCSAMMMFIVIVSGFIGYTGRKREPSILKKMGIKFFLPSGEATSTKIVAA